MKRVALTKRLHMPHRRLNRLVSEVLEHTESAVHGHAPIRNGTLPLGRNRVR